MNGSDSRVKIKLNIRLTSLVLCFMLIAPLCICAKAFDTVSYVFPPLSDYEVPIDGIKGLNGVGLPDMTGHARAGSGVIINANDCTFSDETLIIVGDNLKDSTVFIWCEGGVRRVEPLRCDDTKIQVVVPKDMTDSMMLVWVYKNGAFSSPIRVNAPTVWWNNSGDDHELYANKNEYTVRLFGKCLKVGSFEPRVYVKFDNGELYRLEVEDANPYQIKAKIKKALPKGRICEFYVHNGSGGDLGWSNPVKAEVVEDSVLPMEKLPVFNVDDYGARADDMTDDSAAILRAADAAKESGGGIIQFGKGEYNIAAPVVISGDFPKGLYISGVGMGNYDMKSRLEEADLEHRGLSGDYTLIRFTDPKNIPKNMITVKADNCIVDNMTIIQGDDGKQPLNLYMSGNNLTLKNVRLMKLDVRDFTEDETASFVPHGVLMFDYYCKNILIDGCEVHQAKNGIIFGDVTGTYGWGEYDKSRTLRNIRLQNTDFYGYAEGEYQRAVEMGKNMAMETGETANYASYNVDGLVVENNTSQCYDRENGKIISRFGYNVGSSRNVYISENKLTNVANHPSTGPGRNAGEQFLWHGTGGTYSAIYNLKYTDSDLTVVRTDNIKYSQSGATKDNSGSALHKGINYGDAFYLTIIQGKGVGQQRTILNASEDKSDKTVTFKLDSDWLVEPDETTVFAVVKPFRQIVVYDNTINNNNVLEPGFKSGGVLFFYECTDCYVAENNFKGLTFGVVVNSMFKIPCMWVTVRDNNLTSIKEVYKDAAQGGDTTYNATFLATEFSAATGSVEGATHWSGDKYHSWDTAGIVFKNNTCTDGDVAAEIASRRWHRIRTDQSELEAEHAYDKGGTGTIIENNKFVDVAEGIDIGNPSFWTLVRNNSFTFVNKEGYYPEEIHYLNDPKNFYLLEIKNDKVISDLNNTLNPDYGSESSVKVYVGNEKINFEGIVPEIINSRVMVPARAVAEKLGFNVEWNENESTVICSKNDKVIKLTVGKTSAYVNDAERELDSPVIIKNDRTLIPLRFISEAFGMNVRWDGEQKTVYITD